LREGLPRSPSQGSSAVQPRLLKALLIDDEYGVSGELAEPFDAILSNELRLAAAIKAEKDLLEVIKQERRNGTGQDEADNE
jgi:hypothetical protein